VTGRGLVVDASAILSLLLREPASEIVRAVVIDAVAGGLLVPGHFWIEVVNVLTRRYTLTTDQVVAALRELDDIGIETIAMDRPLLLLGLDLMARHGLTAYDAAYLALAEAEDAPLLTLDARLARAAGLRSALPPARGVHEAPIPYGTVTAPPDWARHGRHLAELRRVATGA
jgi:predicted nucleic acid-binding protein